RIEPDRHHSHYNLGIAFRDKGRLAEAVAQFREAIRLKPDYFDAYRVLADLLAIAADPALRDGAERVKQARKAVDLAPTDSAAWQALGWALYCADAWKESIETFRKSMELQQSPKGGDSGQWFGLAVAYWKLDQREEARTWYGKAVK